ncbi:LON peptidase substrate-binding domain-containing protein [soil metagenome]
MSEGTSQLPGDDLAPHDSAIPDMDDEPSFELPLFPLRAVLFPGGLLGLKVFEARYLDLIGMCLRNNQPFGVVALRQGEEVRLAAGGAPPQPEGDTAFEDTGVLAELIDVDSAQSGILQVRCRGTRRFSVIDSRQEPDGLWMALARFLPDEGRYPVPDTLAGSVKGLETAIETLKGQGAEPFLEPYDFADAGWVANRWCEILPISLAAKQKLMALPDANVRLELVHDFLRSKGVVT